MSGREPRTDPWPETVEAAYRKHLDALLDHARPVCPDHCSAEDACHDVFLRIVRTQRSTESLSLSYLVVAVRNTCRDHLRRERKWQPLGPTVPEPRTTPSPDQHEDPRSLRLTDWRLSLSERQQQTLTLWSEGLSYREIAQTLGVTSKSVGTYLERAKTELRVLAERERERVTENSPLLTTLNTSRQQEYRPVPGKWHWYGRCRCLPKDPPLRMRTRPRTRSG